MCHAKMSEKKDAILKFTQESGGWHSGVSHRGSALMGSKPQTSMPFPKCQDYNHMPPCLGSCHESRS